MLNEHSKTRDNEFKALLDKLVINDLKKLQHEMASYEQSAGVKYMHKHGLQPLLQCLGPNGEFDQSKYGRLANADPAFSLPRKLKPSMVSHAELPFQFTKLYLEYDRDAQQIYYIEIMYGIKLEPVPLDIEHPLNKSNALYDKLSSYLVNIIFHNLNVLHRWTSVFNRQIGVMISEKELFRAALHVYNQYILPEIKPLFDGKAFFIQIDGSLNMTNEKNDFKCPVLAIKDGRVNIIDRIMRAFASKHDERLPCTIHEMQDDKSKLQQIVMDDNEIMKMASNAGVSKYELVDVLYDMLSEFQDIAGYKPSGYEDVHNTLIRKLMFYKFCQEVLKGMKER